MYYIYLHVYICMLYVCIHVYIPVYVYVYVFEHFTNFTNGPQIHSNCLKPNYISALWYILHY